MSGAPGVVVGGRGFKLLDKGFGISSKVGLTGKAGLVTDSVFSIWIIELAASSAVCSGNVRSSSELENTSHDWFSVEWTTNWSLGFSGDAICVHSVDRFSLLFSLDSSSLSSIALGTR